MNFAYRVSLAQNPDRKLCAKLSFPHALWNPDPDAHYDLEKTTNEHKVIEIFFMIAPELVAVPYLCLHIDNMKLLIIQLSEADEQWADQFIDGKVDVR